ncbi:Lipoprotein, partial [Dysosmobacter welbionis]
ESYPGTETDRGGNRRQERLCRGTGRGSWALGCEGTGQDSCSD